MNNTHKNKLIKLNTVKSTNKYIQENIGELLEYNQVLVQAVTQTGGKGYGNNTWEAESGKNLTLSYLFKPGFLKPEKQFLISKFISLGIIDFFELYLVDIKIKWPNDIYAGDKKVAGILIDNSIIGDEFLYSIAGLGLNINQELFNPNLPNPVSLTNITGIKYRLDECRDVLIGLIQTRYKTLQETPDIIDKDYLKYLYRYKMLYPFRYKKIWFKGRITGLDLFGKLIIEKETGEIHSYDYKEVEYMI